MPSTSVAPQLVRRGVPTVEEWPGLIETRRALVVPFFDRFTPSSLKSVECVFEPQGALLELGESHILRGGPRFEEASRVSGVFQYLRGRDTVDNNSIVRKHIWGLERSGDWVSVEVFCDHYKDYKGRRGERALVVEANILRLEEMVNVTGAEYLAIWLELGRVVREWTNRARSRLRDVERLMASVDAEETIYEYLTFHPE